jgi:hypothetical protein
VKYSAGQKFEACYPFTRTTYTDFDEEGPFEVASWKPRIEYVERGPEDTEAIAHGEGKVLLEVIDSHRPGKYPARVFFTRRWRDPDGKVFGNTALRIKTSQAFGRLTKGYRHEYRLALP